jgi:3-hydroxymyristoyl/3-hydroxydecanoyl-(acyl carrier protein) dehydratase
MEEAVNISETHDTVEKFVSTAKLQRHVQRGLVNNIWAYGCYLENEIKLLDLLRNASDSPLSELPLLDLPQILEITDGKPSRVWGGQYADLDTLFRRARLPSPPFLFVSRITGIDAEFGKFRPSHIDMEYDIGEDCVMMLSNSIITHALLLEASQVAILLFSYIGIDLVYNQEITYRILDINGVFHRDLPIKGSTVKARLEFLELVKSGSRTLVKTRFFCYERDELILTLDLLGGFFTEKDLAVNSGVISGKKLTGVQSGQNQIKTEPRQDQITDMQAFLNGDYGPMLCPDRSNGQVERFFAHSKTRMLDRVVCVDYNGGANNLGMIAAEKDVDGEFWAFQSHFKNDPVFPGSLHIVAANQLQILYALNGGYIGDGKYHLGCELEKPIKYLFRGQVKPVPSTIRYEQHLKDIRKTENGVVLVSDCEVFWQENCVVRLENMSLVISNM